MFDYYILDCNFYAAKDRVLIFLSDGVPTDDESSILSILKERNAKLNHTVIVMTYGLGNESESTIIICVMILLITDHAQAQFEASNAQLHMFAVEIIGA